MKRNVDDYIFRESIENPFNPERSRWHIAITTLFPDRVTITNPNNTLAGRVRIDELIETAEVPLLRRDSEVVKIPAEIIDKIVEIVEVAEPTPQNLGANPFES